MNTKATNTVDTVVVIALSVFFYGCIPLFGLFKAYTTENALWLCTWGIWLFMPKATALLTTVITDTMCVIADRVKVLLR